MKVVLIYLLIPEGHKVYTLEGEEAELAVKCHNKLFNFNEDDEEQSMEKLSLVLAGHTPFPIDTPLDISGHDKLVISGMFL